MTSRYDVAEEEGTVEHPMRLTVDELAALGRLRALPEGPRISGDDTMVEAGVRSLVARGLLVAIPDEGRLELTSRLAELASIVAADDGFLVLGSCEVSDPPRPGFSGRLIAAGADARAFAGTVVIEDQRYPGVFEYGTLEPRDLVAYVGALFDLADAAPVERVAASGIADVTVTLRPDGAGGIDPGLPSGWGDATFASVLLVRAGESRLCSWVREGGRVWELRPTAEEADAATVPAVAVAPEVILSQLQQIAEDLSGTSSAGG